MFQITDPRFTLDTTAPDADGLQLRFASRPERTVLIFDRQTVSGAVSDIGSLK